MCKKSKETYKKRHKKRQKKGKPKRAQKNKNRKNWCYKVPKKLQKIDQKGTK